MEKTLWECLTSEWQEKGLSKSYICKTDCFMHAHAYTHAEKKLTPIIRANLFTITKKVFVCKTLELRCWI